MLCVCRNLSVVCDIQQFANEWVKEAALDDVRPALNVIVAREVSRGSTG
jgi:hypothetical protein